MQELHVTRCSLIFWLILFFDITNALKRQGSCFGLCSHCLCPQIQNSHAGYGLLQNKLWYQIPTKNHWNPQVSYSHFFFSLMKKAYIEGISIDIDFIWPQFKQIVISNQVQQNNCLDNTKLLPKQQEYSCPDQWSYMLAERLCPLSNLEPSLCHNEIWSSSCNAKCCFAFEMPVLSLFQESEFLNHEEENTTYNWVFFQLRNGGCWNLFPSAWQGSWIDFKMRNSWQLGQCNEWSEHTNDDDSEKATLWITLDHCKFYSGFNCSE